MLMKTIFKLALLVLLFTAGNFNAQNKTFLTKYAGTYNMLSNGQQATATSDKYVLKPDGSGSWTMFSSVNADGSISNKPVVTAGTWTAEEGVIHLHFAMGGEDLISDFTLKDGAFRAENIFLKKVTAKAKK